MDTYLILIILIFIGAVYSALETALFSLERKKEQEIGKKEVKGFFNNPFIMLNTFLLGNIVANTLFSQFGDVLIEKYLFSLSLSKYMVAFVSVIISTVISVIFIESIPKNFGVAHPKLTYRLFSPFVRLSMIIFGFIVYPLTKLLNWIFQRPSNNKEIEKLTEKEIRSIIKLSYERDIVNPREKKLIDAITNLYSQQIYFFMKPRKEIIIAYMSDTLEYTWNLMCEKKSDTVLIIKDTIDQVVGYVSIQEVGFISEAEKSQTLESYKSKIKTIKLIPESKRLIDAIHLLGQEKRSIALVIDEYGGTQGIISLKGLREMLLSFKNMIENTNESEIFNQPILEEGKNYLIINPLRTNLRFLREYFSFENDIDDEDIDPEESLTRFLLKILDRFPVEGESIIYHRFIFYIERVEKNFVSRVRVSIKERE